MILTITQRHIDEGMVCVASRCAVALALHDAGYKWASVCSDNIMLEGPWEIIPDEKLKEFIVQFDDNPDLCKPGEYEFEVTSWIPEERLL